MSEFFAMGGHGLFVWGSYAVCSLAIVGLTLQSLLEARARRAELKRLKALKLKD